MKWLHLLLVLGSMLLSAPAGAQPADARAREYFTKGTEHFQAGRYLEAQAAYAAGYELSQKPGFLWNMAECSRLLGRRERALELYRSYLREAPNGPDRADAERHIRELEPASAPRIDPAPSPPASAPAPATAATQPGSTSTAPLVPRADSGTASHALTTAPANDADKKPIYQRWWFWTGAGALATAAAVTVVVLATSSTASTSPAAPKPSGVDWRR